MATKSRIYRLISKIQNWENKLFIKIISNEIYDKTSSIKLEVENSLDINDYEIIHNYKNCYFLN